MNFRGETNSALLGRRHLEEQQWGNSLETAPDLKKDKAGTSLYIENVAGITKNSSHGKINMEWSNNIKYANIISVLTS